MIRKHKYANASRVKDHYADGGRVYGPPMETPKPGSTTRKRPKPGDKDPNYKPRKPRKSKPAESAPEPTKPAGTGGSRFRDYRGTPGAIEDAGG